jgi:hypothetical protein
MKPQAHTNTPMVAKRKQRLMMWKTGVGHQVFQKLEMNEEIAEDDNGSLMHYLYLFKLNTTFYIALNILS